MRWFMEFLASPRGSLVRLAGVIGIVIVLFFALAQSPHGVAPVLVGIGVTSALLLMMRIPWRFIAGIAVGEFVILGIVSLVTELAASGVLALLAVVAGVFLVVAVVRWAGRTATRRNPGPWSRRSGLRPWWLPQRRRRYR